VQSLLDDFDDDAGDDTDDGDAMSLDPEFVGGVEIEPDNFATASPTFQPNLGASRSVNGIRFSNGAGAFTLSGTGSPTLTLGASGISQQDNTGQTIAASLSLALGAAASFQTTSTGALTIASAVNNADDWYDNA
jgi:hypothetical protein